MKAIYKKLTASASALTMLAASMAVGGVSASAASSTDPRFAGQVGDSTSGTPIGVITDIDTDSDYTISIPSTLDVTQAGWNELTGGISAKGSLGQHEKLVVSATSANDWALVSDGNRIGYNLAKSAADYDPNAETPSWEFEELNADGVSQSAGVNVENFDDKPAGEYTDTVTFTAKLEDVPIPLQSISLNKSSMVLFTEDFNSENTTEKLSVNFNPEDTTDDKTVTWSSSNPAVATVDQDGKVTAVATGDAVITATTANGKKASCNVAVNKVTITSYEAPYKANNYDPLPDFTKDGIVKVSFDAKGDECGNDHSSDGWFFYGDDATVTVTSLLKDVEIEKVKFYTKKGSAEVTNAPFTVYSYGYYMYTGPNRTGICFNDWGVNKIEVYMTVVKPQIKTLTLSSSYFDYDTGGSREISETIEYTDDDTWADIVEKYDWLVTRNYSNAPDGIIIYHKTNVRLEVKSSESTHNYNLVSINDKVSDYPAESYYFGM